MRVADSQPHLEAFARQAKSCADMGAPFTARLCRLLGHRLDDTTALGARVLAWPLARLTADLVPLRCCAALNLKVMTGQAPELATFYPPRAAGDVEDFWRGVEATIARDDAWLADFLTSPPQTNEVSRSGILLAGFLSIARATGMPLALHELGASAGLNLLFDAYAYDLGGGRRWGQAGSPVRIPCTWEGAAPALDTPLVVQTRQAVDLRPIDAADPSARDRLMAYVWPEQADRVARIRAALDLSVARGTRVDAGDALDWTNARLAAPQAEGTCRVFYHSVFIQYLPQELRQALRERLKQAGEAATPSRPFAWLAMEAAPEAPQTCQLSLAVWPGGARRVLAEVDWHGRRARFLTPHEAGEKGAR